MNDNEHVRWHMSLRRLQSAMASYERLADDYGRGVVSNVLQAIAPPEDDDASE